MPGKKMMKKTTKKKVTGPAVLTKRGEGVYKKAHKGKKKK
jgi:hypothetical protein